MTNVEGCSQPNYHYNPLITPLLEFHGRVLKTFDSLPQEDQADEISSRIACIVAAPFAYLAFAFLAMAGIILNSIWEQKHITQIEREISKPLPSPIGGTPLDPINLKSIPLATPKKELKVLDKEETSSPLQQSTQPVTPENKNPKGELVRELEFKGEKLQIYKKINEHKETYTLGSSYMTLDINKEHVSIYYIESHRYGFGRLLVHEAIRRSCAPEFQGNIRLKAAWSSHAFWLAMGFLPDPDERIEPTYGANQKNVDAVIKTITEEQWQDNNEKALPKKLKSMINQAREMLAWEACKKLGITPDEDIWDEKVEEIESSIDMAYIKKHWDSKAMQIKYKVSERLKEMIEEQFAEGKKRADTESYGAVEMCLPKETFEKYKLELL